METTTEKKKMGNPNFGKKKEADIEKIYEFELIKTYELYKPEIVILTSKTQERSVGKNDSVYPPMMSIPNCGLAYDEVKKEQRAWRFINTENSIWIDEQRELTGSEEATILSLPENQLEFEHGKLFVRAIEKSKVNALLIQDMYEDKKVKLRNTPPVYRLLNPEAILKATQAILDQAWEAESLARKSSEEEMYEFCHVLGINLEQSDDAIRKDFIVKAKSNPEYFLKHFVNPKNRYTFAFAQALKDNVLSVNKDSGKLIWAESGSDILSVNPLGNVSDQLASMAVAKDDKVLSLFAQISKM
jgi:hypothetical protein